MQDFFITFYGILHGVQPPDWDDVYITTGILLIGVSFMMAIVYYYILNKYFLQWFKVSRWFLVMLVNSLFVGILAYFISIDKLQPDWLDGTVLSFTFVNILYAAIVYLIASCLVCWGSPRAKYTPLRFLVK